MHHLQVYRQTSGILHDSHKRAVQHCKFSPQVIRDSLLFKFSRHLQGACHMITICQYDSNITFI